VQQFRRSVVIGWTDVAVPRGYEYFWRVGNADGDTDPEQDGATIIPVIDACKVWFSILEAGQRWRVIQWMWM